MTRTRLLVFVALLAAACASRDVAENRDRHGPPDVDRYIEMLQRDERVRELDPEGVIRRLSIEPSAVVADLGAGPGVFTLPLSRHLSQGLVYAVDVEPRQLDALRERLRAEGRDNVVPVLASYGDPHLPPGGVDWIFLVDTYHHLEERVAYLRTLREDLAPGGRLVILEYLPGELPVGPPAAHKLSHEQRFGELRAAGFEQLERFDMHRYHDFEVWGMSEEVTSRGGGAVSLRRWISLRFPGVDWVDTGRLADWLAAPAPPLLLDARSPGEFEVSRLPGARRVDPDAREYDLGAIPAERPIVVYCSVGYRSAAVARRLERAGHDRVYNLEGGIFAWANQGRPVQREGLRVYEVHPYDRRWGRFLSANLHSGS